MNKRKFQSIEIKDLLATDTSHIPSWNVIDTERITSLNWESDSSSPASDSPPPLEFKSSDSDSNPQISESVISGHNVICFHPKTVQKSYGNEKRFICPPPLLIQSSPSVSCTLACAVTVVVDRSTQKSIHPENMLAPLTTSFDKLDNLPSIDESLNTRKKPRFKGNSSTEPCVEHVVFNGSDVVFKNLWVHSNSKVCHLQIETDSFVKSISNPISVVSKPSKKTTKSQSTYGTNSFFIEGSIISLYNRTNGQTYRTQHLYENTSNENNDFLVTRSCVWTPFHVFKAGSCIKHSLINYLENNNIDSSHLSDYSTCQCQNSSESIIHYNEEIILISSISFQKLIQRISSIHTCDSWSASSSSIYTVKWSPVLRFKKVEKNKQVFLETETEIIRDLSRVIIVIDKLSDASKQSSENTTPLNSTFTLTQDVKFKKSSLTLLTAYDLIASSTIEKQAYRFIQNQDNTQLYPFKNEKPYTELSFLLPNSLSPKQNPNRKPALSNANNSRSIYSARSIGQVCIESDQEYFSVSDSSCWTIVCIDSLVI